MNWMTANDAPVWLPALNAAEAQYGIPTNLLARIAFQESSFRPEVIDGSERSPDNCIGIMQLNPTFYPNAGDSPDNDIETAAQLVSALHRQFQDWQLVLAAYNWGSGNVRRSFLRHQNQYVLDAFPVETQNYVRQVVADVPVPGCLVPIGEPS